jgi:site-specific recombinase XerD
MSSIFLKKIYNKKLDKTYRVYYLKYTEGGKTITVSTGHKSKQGANEFWKNFKHNTFNKKIDLKLLEKEVLEYVRLNGFKSQSSYKNTFKRFIAFTGNKELSQVTRNNVINFIASRKKEMSNRGGLFSPGSINHDISNLRKAFRIAEENDWIDKNPARFIPKSKTTSRVPDFQEHEIDILLKDLKKNAKIDYYYAVVIAFNCGLRRMEVVSLNWNKIDMEARTITLSNKMDGIEEPIGFNDVVYKIFLILQARKIKSSEGFIWGYKMSDSTLYQNLKKAVFRNNLNPKLTLHSTRHSAITVWVNKYGIHNAKDMARHRTIAVTAGYLHTKQEQINKLGRESKIT